MTEPQITIRHIAVIVAEEYGSSLALMRGHRRKSEDVHPRQVAMYLAHHHIGQTLPAIARWFSNRDHTTVLHAIRRVAEKAGRDRALAGQLKRLGERINEAEARAIAASWSPPKEAEPPPVTIASWSPPKEAEPPPVTIAAPPPPASDEPGARRVIDAVRGYVESRRALSDAAFTSGEAGARRRVEAEYAMLARAWGDYAARRGRS